MHSNYTYNIYIYTYSGAFGKSLTFEKRKEIDVLSCFVMFRVIQNEMQPKLRGLDHQPRVMCKTQF